MVKKPELQAQFVEVLQRAQRVPTVVTHSLNLEHYEVLDCEQLHDLKGHFYNLLPEFVALLTNSLQQECKMILESTLVKDKTCRALYRAAAAKLIVQYKSHTHLMLTYRPF